MKRTRCIKAEQIEERHGFTINREEDKQYNDFTGEYYGRTYVFYTVNDPNDGMLESFKTLREAQKYIEKIL